MKIVSYTTALFTSFLAKVLIQDAPAPLIVHITDGKYDGADPTPIAKRIMNMSVPDGNVLIQNLYIGSPDVPKIADISKWPGFTSAKELTDTYSKQLFDISSPIPESYRSVLEESGFSLAQEARMFFPGSISEIIELGFVVSGATRVLQ